MLYQMWCAFLDLLRCRGKHQWNQWGTCVRCAKAKDAPGYRE